MICHRIVHPSILKAGTASGMRVPGQSSAARMPGTGRFVPLLGCCSTHQDFARTVSEPIPAVLVTLRRSTSRTPPAERRYGNAFATVETDGTFPALEGTFGAPFDGTMIFARVYHRFNPSHKLLLRWGADLSDARLEISESQSCAVFSSTGVPFLPPNTGSITRLGPTVSWQPIAGRRIAEC